MGLVKANISDTERDELLRRRHENQRVQEWCREHEQEILAKAGDKPVAVVLRPEWDGVRYFCSQDEADAFLDAQGDDVWDIAMVMSQDPHEAMLIL